MKKIIIISFCILVIILACCISGQSNNQEELIQKILEENNYIVVDVRTNEEYEEGHVKDAINIPYDEIDENVELDKTKTIMVYCKSGKRSNIAYNTLKDLGYTVVDLGAYDTVTLEKGEAEGAE